MRSAKAAALLAFTAGVFCTLIVKDAFDVTAEAQVRETPRVYVAPSAVAQAGRAVAAATQADLDVLRSDIASMKTQLNQTTQDTQAAKLTANLANNWINVTGAPAASWIGSTGSQLAASMGQQANDTQAILSNLNQIKTELTDVQHRGAMECFLVASVYTRGYPVAGAFSEKDYINMCNGAYWQPGVTSTRLKAMIPYAY